MNKVIITVLSCLVGFASAGVFDMYRTFYEKNILSEDAIVRMSQDELYRQKFLLDILMVEKPLVDIELLNRGELVEDVNKYIEGIDEEMQTFIDSCRKGLYIIADEKPMMRQMIGLYRLLVRATDWDTFERIACYARVNIKPTVFLKAMLLAIRDRSDTQKLIIPATYEMLPSLFFDERTLRTARQVIPEGSKETDSSLNAESLRPSFWDLIEKRRQSRLDMKNRIFGGEFPFGFENKMQLWMPWRDLRTKMIGSLAKATNKNLMIPVDPESLVLQNDMGLNIFWKNLVNELILKAEELQQMNYLNEKRQPEMKTNLDEVEVEDTKNNFFSTGESIAEGRRVKTIFGKPNFMFNEKKFPTVMSDRERFDSRQMEDSTPTYSRSFENRYEQNFQNRNDMFDKQFQQKQDVFERNLPRYTEDFYSKSAQSEKETVSVRPQSFFNPMTETSTKMLPISDVNSERLLHVSRRRQLTEDQGFFRNTIYSNQHSGMIQIPIEDNTKPNTNQNQYSYDKFTNVYSTNSDNDRLLKKSRRSQKTLRSDSMKDYKKNMTTPYENSELKTGGQKATVDMGQEKRVRLEKQMLFLNDEQNGGMQEGIFSTNDDEIRRPEDRRRLTRSIFPAALRNIREGEVLLYTLQQILARIQIEGISKNFYPMYNSDLMGQRLQRHDQGLFGESSKFRYYGMVYYPPSSPNQIERITNLEERFGNLIADRLRREVFDTKMQTTSEFDRIIGNMLLGKEKDFSLVSLIQEIISEKEYSIGMSDEINLVDNDVLSLLDRLMFIIERERQRFTLASYTIDELAMNGVRINKVFVSKLKTFAEFGEADLIYTMPPVPSQTIVARKERLTHKPFSVSMDVTSSQSQEAILRILLLPATDSTGKILPLDVQRRLAILLDSSVIHLNAGSNIITRKSSDINWTAPDATRYTEIYRRVMIALASGVENMPYIDKSTVGQSCRFPERLLLPRGHADGLPMQLLVVISPMNKRNMNVPLFGGQMVCGIGMGTLSNDDRSMTYPLDRGMEFFRNMDYFKNMHLQDVKIYGEEL